PISSASPQRCRKRADASRSGYRSRRITGKEFRLVSQAMPRNPPRYDVPNAAPEPLRFVQRFVNTVNLESGEDWLASWFEDEGVAATGADLERARIIREAIRELLYANNRQGADAEARAVLTSAADAAAFTIDFSGPAFAARAHGVDGA